MNGKLTLEKFMEMNPEIVSALETAENDFRTSYSKRTMAESQPVSMSSYKEAIQNTKTSTKEINYK